MAVFSTSRPSPKETSANGERRHALSIVAPGATLVGNVDAEGIVKIEGRVEGFVRGREQVLVAKGGVVEGDIESTEAMIAGEVRGNIVASARVELQPGCVVHGDVTAPRVVVQEGGELNGRLRMSRDAGQSATNPAVSAAVAA